MFESRRITIRHPQPYDIVDDPVRVCGIGTAFEGRFAARLRDADGVLLQQTPVETGGTGIWNEFQAELQLPSAPPTDQGTVEALAYSPRDGSEIDTIVVPVIFGRALIEPYHGFTQYAVRAGDSLSSIAEQFYGDDSQWQRVLDANRHQLINPDRVFVGQVLRIPQ